MTVTSEEIKKISKSLNPMIEELTTKLSEKIATQLDNDRNLKKIEHLENLLHQIIIQCTDARWQSGWGATRLHNFASGILQLACYNTDEYRNIK
jgi:hypothetical protein